MPLMPTCMVGDGAISLLGQGRATHGFWVQIFDHEADIPGFVNDCCLVCGKPVKTKRAQKSHSRTFHLRQDVWSNVVETRCVSATS